jgi:hypothetical protein
MMRWATWRGAFFNLMSGAALKRVKPRGEAEERLHRGDVGIDSRCLDRQAVVFDAHGGEGSLDVLDVPDAGSRRRRDVYSLCPVVRR